jgi:hypothetical protein
MREGEASKSRRSDPNGAFYVQILSMIERAIAEPLGITGTRMA